MLYNFAATYLFFAQEPHTLSDKREREEAEMPVQPGRNRNMAAQFDVATRTGRRYERIDKVTAG
jgi:hypothetical protein